MPIQLPHGLLPLEQPADHSPLIAQEAAVLTDFGMCFDLRKNRIVDFKVSAPNPNLP